MDTDTRRSIAATLVVVAVLGSTTGCGGDDQVEAEAAQLLQVAGLLYAEQALAGWLFDNSSAEEGIGRGLPAIERVQQLEGFVADRYASCGQAESLGESIRLLLDDCPGPFDAGRMSGELYLTFGNVTSDGTVHDFMLMESAGEVALKGHTMVLKHYAESSTLLGRFAFVSDVRGTSSGGVTVDLTGDRESEVDPVACTSGTPHTNGTPCELAGIADIEGAGCLHYHRLSEGNPTVDGVRWTSVYGGYRKCPGQCPGPCNGDIGCQLQGGTPASGGVIVDLDGGPTTAPPHDIEVDCSD